MTSVGSEMHNITHKSLDDNRAISAAIVFGITGVAIFAVIPFLVGALVDHLALSPRQSGFIASADVIGMAIGNLAAFFWVRRVSWNKMAWLAIGVLISANLICIDLSSFQSILMLRFLIGLAEGTCLALTYALLGSSRNPDRNFGIFLIGSLSFGAANVFVLSRLAPIYGSGVFFLDLAIVAVFAAVFVRYIPAHGSRVDDEQHSAHTGDNPAVLLGPAIIALIANLVYYIGLGGVWAYLERIGIANGLAAEDIGTGLSVSMIAAGAGALVATIVNLRIGRAGPLALAIFSSICCLFILKGNVGFGSFLLAVCIWNFVNNYAHPYLLGYMAAIDRSGQYVVASGGMQTGGMGIGPAIAALVITGPIYTNVLWLGIICFAITFALFVPIMILYREIQPAPASTSSY